MIRKAVLDDMEQFDSMFEEYFQYEKKIDSYTAFQRGIFPTHSGMENAIRDGVVYVYDDNGTICGSVIFDAAQPPEFADIPWQYVHAPEEVMTIHLFIVRPAYFRQGIATAMMNYGFDLARSKGCKVMRTECGSQNLPAVMLFKQLGFERAAVASIVIEGLVPADGHVFLEKSLA
ncbi:MAG: GNAT family N-acetyltransferase [Peptococcaceae bacterium]|nr:GNAT family N-acetyltransferase [Peptococcaceae bacterium]